MDISNISYSLHFIDYKSENKGRISELQEGDVEKYIDHLLERIKEEKNQKSFAIQSVTTEVVSTIIKLLNEEITLDETTEIISDRLLREEVKAQKQIGHMQDLNTGSLFQAYITNEETDQYIIAKVEDITILDKTDCINRTGLPYEKEALKLCIFTISKDKEIIDIIVNDANNRISTYWWNSFLELKVANTDEDNTKNSFNSVKNLLSRKIKKQSPQDFTKLKHSVIVYYRAHPDFSFDNMVNDIFENYTPDNPEEVDMKSITEQLRKLPEQKNFDIKFTVIPKEINSRIRTTYPVNNAVDIKVKEGINDVTKTIISVEEPDGKFIKIKTDNEDTFKSFNFK